jgi:hypothetical protein
LKEGTQHKVEYRLALLRRAVALAMIAGLLLSPNLWVSSRAYPLTPLFGFIPPLPYPVDHAVFGLFIVIIGGMALVRGRAAGWLALSATIIAVLFILQDQSRLQPWFYQYSFLIAAVSLFGLDRVGAVDALNSCRLIVAATYFFSGLQKANASFMGKEYPSIVEPLMVHLSSGVQDILLWGAYAVPVIEATIGLGLLTRRFRKPAVIGTLLMHGFILLCVGPWGANWNSVIWPWNVAMVLFTFILFWQPADNPSLLEVLLPWRRLSEVNLTLGLAFRALVVALFALMPVLSFFGLWDSYLSASLYSGNIKLGHVFTWNGSKWIDTNITADFPMKALNVPAYPEDRVYKNVFVEEWCAQDHSSKSRSPEPVLLVYDKPDILTGERSEKLYRC